ncbi:MAG TPA: glycosyltransferase family 2 protein [Patescibacteria group bacterium]|nr:glycosyltransferase family 2 protein [Patescibacteria group bacterium]
MSHPRLSIVIVNWNVRDVLEKNLEVLFAEPVLFEKEVIVIDNASNDGSSAMVREKFPNVRLIINDWNAGFAHAVNQGWRIAQGNVVLLLNPDMKIRPGSLQKTVEILEADQTIGILGGHLLNREGKTVPSVRHDPSLWDQLAIVLKLPHLFPKVVDRYLAKDFPYAQSQDVEQVRGSYFAFRRGLSEIVGFFDERYFLWFEEVDFCKRVREKGLCVRYEASLEAEDLGSLSFRQVSVRRKQWLFSSSLTKYFFKWHPWWQGTLFWKLRPFAIGVGAVIDAGRWMKRRGVRGL